jgi:hypothetical protein
MSQVISQARPIAQLRFSRAWPSTAPGIGGQGDTDQLFAVVDVKATVGESRRAPDYVAATGVLAGFEHFRPADRFETLRSKPAEQQLPLIVPDEHTLVVLDKKSGPKQTRLHYLFAFPNAIAGPGVQTAHLPVTANPVNVIVLPHGGAHHGM